jgi:hypothetical protein
MSKIVANIFVTSVSQNILLTVHLKKYQTEQCWEAKPILAAKVPDKAMLGSQTKPAAIILAAILISFRWHLEY